MKRQIITAFAESAAGPGWANSPIWVIEQDEAGVLHKECIQPSKQNHEMATLYAVSQAAHLAMLRAVRAAKRGE